MPFQVRPPLARVEAPGMQAAQITWAKEFVLATLHKICWVSAPVWKRQEPLQASVKLHCELGDSLSCVPRGLCKHNNWLDTNGNTKKTGVRPRFSSGGKFLVTNSVAIVSFCLFAALSQLLGPNFLLLDTFHAVASVVSVITSNHGDKSLHSWIGRW